MEEVEGIVVDFGTSTIKAGLSGYDAPSVIFPTIVDTNKQVGFDCTGKQIQFEQGIINDWDSVELILSHAIKELKTTTKDRPFLLIEKNLSPASNREKFAEILFETFNSPHIYISSSASLSLYSSGRLTGLVVESGEYLTHSVPIYQGHPLNYATEELNIGGNQITIFLMQLLTQRGYSCKEEYKKEFEIIKEKLTHVSFDFEDEMKTQNSPMGYEKHYELPDGEMIILGDERFRCCEILFQPHLFYGENSNNNLNNNSNSKEGIHSLINKSINKVDFGIQREICSNIVLAGGSTLFNGFNTRLQKELSSVVSSTIPVKIISPYERQFSSFIGGSILSSYSDFVSKNCLSKSDFNEIGSKVLHQKFY